MKLYFGENEKSAYLTPYDFSDFQSTCESMFKQCEVGPKSGMYFMVADKMKEDMRNEENIISSCIIVIDGDKSIMSETSSVPLITVHNALLKADINHCIYSTHSHNPPEVHKFRLIVEVQSTSKVQFRSNVEYLYSVIAITGIKVSSESFDWAHLWFLPRAADIAKFEYYDHHAGKNMRPQKFSMSAIAKPKPLEDTPQSVIDYINVLRRGVPGSGINDSLKKLTLNIKSASPGFVKEISKILLKDGEPDQTERQKTAIQTGEIDRLIKGAIALMEEPDREWQPPHSLLIPLNEFKVDFPVDILPKILREAAQEMADFNLCTIHDTILGIFPVIGAAIGRKLLLQAGTPSLEVYPNLGVINIADTGAFKSTLQRLQTKGLMDALKAKVSKYNTELPNIQSKIYVLEKRLKKADDDALSNKDSKDDVKMIFKLMEKSNADRKALEELKCIRNPGNFADDNTMEQMAVMGFEAGGEINIFSAEGQSIFKSMSDAYQKSKSNTDLLIKGLSGDMYTRGRVGDKRMMSYIPIINMSFFVQPDIYRNQFLFNDDVHSSGLAARPITHTWRSCFEKKKTIDTYVADVEKMQAYWKRIFDIAVVDDRNFEDRYHTQDDIFPHMVRPISKITYDAKYAGVYIQKFNEIRKRQESGNDLENKGAAVNKCFTQAYVIAACIKVFDAGDKFFESKLHSFSVDDLENVGLIVEYLIEKKLAEFRVIEEHSKILNAAVLLKLLTTEKRLPMILKGITTSVFNRWTRTSDREKAQQYVEGESMLEDMGYLRFDDKTIVLNPLWDKQELPSFIGNKRGRSCIERMK